jgi:hypothetical protein
MDLSHWIWLATAAYAIHMIEEFMLDWRDWARAVIGLPVDWPDFYVTNGIVMVLALPQKRTLVSALRCLLCARSRPRRRVRVTLLRNRRDGY